MRPPTTRPDAAPLRVVPCWCRGAVAAVRVASFGIRAHRRHSGSGGERCAAAFLGHCGALLLMLLLRLRLQWRLLRLLLRLGLRHWLRLQAHLRRWLLLLMPRSLQRHHMVHGPVGQLCIRSAALSTSSSTLLRASGKGIVQSNSVQELLDRYSQPNALPVHPRVHCPTRTQMLSSNYDGTETGS